MSLFNFYGVVVTIKLHSAILCQYVSIRPRDRYDNFRLLLVGDGETRPELITTAHSSDTKA